MVTPLNLKEQSKQMYFVPDYWLLVCFSNTTYDAAWKRDKRSEINQVLEDFPPSENFEALREGFRRYGATDTGPCDIYTMNDGTTKSNKDQVIKSINQRLEKNPNKKFMIVYLFQGHGMQDNNRKQVIVLNEFNERTKFYKLWSIENDIQTIAKKHANSYQLAFFNCGREVLDFGLHSGGFPSKAAAEYFYANNSEESVMHTLTAYSAMRDEHQNENLVSNKPDQSTSIHQKRQNYVLFFGCQSGEKISQDSDMAYHVAEMLLNSYNRSSFSLQFPQVLSDIQDQDDDVELITSNTLQPVWFTYQHQTAAAYVGAIFIHKDSDDREFGAYMEKAENIQAQLRDKLGFHDVKIYISLSKSQMIEKLDLIQLKVKHLGRKLLSHEVVAVAIVSIGYVFNPLLYPLHARKMEAENVKLPEISEDETKYYPQYIFTKDDYPICMAEYCSRIASESKTYVLQFDDCEPNAFPSWQKSMHELVLKKRPGQLRHQFLKQAKLDQVCQVLDQVKDDKHRNAYQLPYILTEGMIEVESWQLEEQLDQIIIGVDDKARNLLRKNLNSNTYKNDIDIWQDKPKLAQLEISKKEWKPSIHNIGEKVVHIVSQKEDYGDPSESSSEEQEEQPAKQEEQQQTPAMLLLSLFQGQHPSQVKSQVSNEPVPEKPKKPIKPPTTDDDIAFVFYDKVFPFEETGRIRVPRAQFKAGTVLTTQKHKDKSFIYASLFTTEETNEPCKLLKIEQKDGATTFIDSFTPSYDETEIFKSCFQTQTDKIILITRYYIKVFNNKLDSILELYKRDIHDQIWWLGVAQLSVNENDEDSFVMACEMKSSYRPKFKKARPNNFYKGPSVNSDTWIVRCKVCTNCDHVDEKIMTLEQQSMLIVDKKVMSIVEFAEDKIMVHISLKDLLVVINWEVVHRVTVSLLFQLEHCLILPEFNYEDNFAFFLSFGTDRYDLVNVNSGSVEPLINGSANNILGQQSAFIQEYQDSIFDLNFCTNKQNLQGDYEQQWLQMHFNSDFINCLRDFGRLPVNSLDEAMQVIKSEGDLKQRLDFIEKSDSQQKAKLDQLQKLQEDIHVSKQLRTETEISKKLCNNLIYQLAEQKQEYEGKLKEAQNQQVQLNFSVMAQMKQQKKESQELTKKVQEARDIAERERNEKLEVEKVNQDFLKKIMALSLNKVKLLKMLKSNGVDQDTAEADVYENIVQMMEKVKNKKIGGIPWGDLKSKRADSNFDHMSFWSGLNKDDKETLIYLLKHEQDQITDGTKPDKLQKLLEQDELEEKEKEVQKAGNEIKALKEENENLKKRLQEKDKLLRSLVKAQVKANYASGQLDISNPSVRRPSDTEDPQVNLSKVSYEERRESFEFSSGLNIKPKRETIESQQEMPKEFRVSPTRDKSSKKKRDKTEKKEKKEKREKREERSRSHSQSFSGAISPPRSKDEKIGSKKMHQAASKATAFVLPNKGLASGSFILEESQPPKVSVMKPEEFALSSSGLLKPENPRKESQKRESSRRGSSRQRVEKREKKTVSFK